jgi:hypothetical protein
VTSPTRDWIRQEAAHQGLALTDADVEAVYERVRTIKEALAAMRSEATDDLEPPYRFAVPEEAGGPA